MLYVIKRINGLLSGSLFFCFCLCAAAAPALAADQPGRLTIVPDSGLILLDYDTLKVSGVTTLEIAPGDHVLSFFPSHSAGRWAHRYLEYPFSLGASGSRAIDLTACRVFSLRSEPQDARIDYRGRTVGRTPGDYLLLTGADDSLTFKLRGYQTRSLMIDSGGIDKDILFVSLNPSTAEEYESDVEQAIYISPLKQISEPRMLLSLGAGAALLSIGVLYNGRADDHYERYLRLAGSAAQEKAYQDAVRNDRISKAAFIAGNASIGLLGYFVIRKLVLKNPGSSSNRSPLSLKSTSRGAELTYEF